MRFRSGWRGSDGPPNQDVGGDAARYVGKGRGFRPHGRAVGGCFNERVGRSTERGERSPEPVEGSTGPGDFSHEPVGRSTEWGDVSTEWGERSPEPVVRSTGPVRRLTGWVGRSPQWVERSTGGGGLLTAGLADFFAASPLRESGLEIERLPDL
jgi:hypothetical protein